MFRKLLQVICSTIVARQLFRLNKSVFSVLQHLVEICRTCMKIKETHNNLYNCSFILLQFRILMSTCWMFWGWRDIMHIALFCRPSTRTHLLSVNKLWAPMYFIVQNYRDSGFYFGTVILLRGIYIDMPVVVKCCSRFIHCYWVCLDLALIDCVCTRVGQGSFEDAYCHKVTKWNWILTKGQITLN